MTIYEKLISDFVCLLLKYVRDLDVRCNSIHTFYSINPEFDAEDAENFLDCIYCVWHNQAWA